MRRLVLGIAVAVTSLIPVMGMADDQQIADFIKARLQAEQQQGNLKGFNVDMRVEQGTVWFSLSQRCSLCQLLSLKFRRLLTSSLSPHSMFISSLRIAKPLQHKSIWTAESLAITALELLAITLAVARMPATVVG